MALVCLMTVVLGANAHNTHYPTYTEDGITYIKTGGRISIAGKGAFDTWYVLEVNKPNDKTITIPYEMMIDGKEVRITEIMPEAFSYCSSLDSLILSNGVRIGDETFIGCNELKYLYFDYNSSNGSKMKFKGLTCKTLETSTGINSENFWKTVGASLEKIIIRDTKFIHTRMDYCEKLKTIICYSLNPPLCEATDYNSNCLINFEEYQWSTITLYVPRESLENYYFDRVWGEIDNIYAIDEMKEETSISDYEETTYNNETTSIRNIDGNTLKENVWYSLNGVKVNNPTKGFYIKNGKKYIVK